MKYQPTTTPIPKERRADVNDKILAILEHPEFPGTLTKEDVFNAYTGIGGLHGLDRSQFDNYFEFSEEKKEIEQGQFFTAPQVVEAICKHLPVESGDTIADLCCGAGVFFNSLPEAQCYGCDIDHKAIRVAKFLYPEAHIDTGDIRYWDPGVRFDFIVGNPPFNLRWTVKNSNAWKDSTDYLSQHYYCLRAAELLKPGGILICIVPDSYMKDEFFTKSMVEEMNDQFSFLFQYTLDKAAFKNMGVAAFNTKVICFQARAEAIEAKPYKTVYLKNPEQEVEEIFSRIKQERHTFKLKFRQEMLSKFGSRFNGISRKYLYEIKMHPSINRFYSRALAKIDQLHTQVRPANVKEEEWDKSKLTENKVLAYLRQIVHLQGKKDLNEIRLVKTCWGLKLKSYDRKSAIRLKKLYPVTTWTFNELILHPSLKVPNMEPWMGKLIKRKTNQFVRQTALWKEMGRNEQIDKFLDKFAWYNIKNEKCKFNAMQHQDLGLVLQKDYGILNWQMGTGKTAAIACWSRYKDMTNTFVISAALAINMTWEPFMVRHNKKYIIPKTITDIQNLKPGTFVLLTLDYLIKLRKHIKKYVKICGQQVNFVFDESDEITNPGAKRTQVVLDCFRRAKRKLLATGTTTRNNITELYSQLELLYNNSANMLCFCEKYRYEDKDNNLITAANPYHMLPFPARGGSLWFKRCFNPARSTVFGIQRHNQDIYNEVHLRKLLEYTIITRKFKEIAGDKYTVISDRVRQNAAEEKVYSMIIRELNKILPEYFQSTGNSRKDAMLRVLRQLQLLIKATSIPHLFKEWEGGPLPNKVHQIFERVSEHNEKIAIGCTSLEAVEWYEKVLRERFIGRQVFKIVGDVSFIGREKIRKAFESTEDGILICTQQSLKSSVNIPSCSRVIIESKQWNIPKIEQFFFRFIRYDSPNNTEVVFISYENTIEMNLLALLMAKEKLNDYIKTLEYRDDSDVYEEYDIDLDILNSIITKEQDSEGKVKIKWGKASVV